ncbi:MAG: hypothetical protein A2161_22165, partial [Candidatus Schekmanbacteria bacterium RBG_13_48_7]
PLYPYFLAFIYALFGGGNLLAVRLIQVLIGSLIPVVMYIYCRRIFSWNEAVLSGSIIVFYGILIFYEGLILKVTLSLFVTTLMFLVLTYDKRITVFRAFIGGISFGLSCLFRGNMLLFFPFILIFLVIQSRIQIFSRLVMFVIGVIICILPVTAFNYYRENDFILLTGHGGQNLYVGFNEYADGKAGRPPFLRANPKYEEYDARKYAEKETGRSLKPSEISSFWKKKAFEYIKVHPSQAIQLLWLKFRLFFNGYEIPDNKNFYFDRKFSPVLYVGFVNYGVIAPLGILGFFLTIPLMRKTFLLHTFMIVYSMSIIIFHVYSRYRIPVLAAMVPFASHSVFWFIDKLKSKKWNQFLAGIIMLLALAGFVNQNLGEYSFAQWHFNQGKGYAVLGDSMNAVKSFQEALKIAPTYAEAWNNLGLIHFQQDKLYLAVEEFTKAIECNKNLAETYLNLGTCYVNSGNFDKAESLFREAISRNPEYEKAYFNLGRLYILKNENQKAVEVLETARRMDPANKKFLFNLAETYEKVDMKKALELWRTLFATLSDDNESQQIRSEISLHIHELESGEIPDKP